MCVQPTFIGYLRDVQSSKWDSHVTKCCTNSSRDMGSAMELIFSAEVVLTSCPDLQGAFESLIYIVPSFARAGFGVSRVHFNFRCE